MNSHELADWLRALPDVPVKTDLDDGEVEVSYVHDGEETYIRISVKVKKSHISYPPGVR